MSTYFFSSASYDAVRCGPCDPQFSSVGGVYLCARACDLCSGVGRDSYRINIKISQAVAGRGCASSVWCVPERERVQCSIPFVFFGPCCGWVAGNAPNIVSVCVSHCVCSLEWCFLRVSRSIFVFGSVSMVLAPFSRRQLYGLVSPIFFVRCVVSCRVLRMVVFVLLGAALSGSTPRRGRSFLF